jgi:15-cis-phytoene synthase
MRMTDDRTGAEMDGAGLSGDGRFSAPAVRAGDFAACLDMIKRLDKDRHAALLFAPAEHRNPLSAIQAFGLEIARVRDIVSDPLPGEVRYQWWLDVLTGDGHGEVSAHPVAAALLETIRSGQLPLKPFTDLIEARTFDLYDDLFPDVAALEGYCGEISSALIQLSCIILSGGREAGPADAVGHAGVAFALTGLLRAFPWSSRRGQVHIPKATLDQAGADRGDIVNGRDTPALREALRLMRNLARHHLTETRRHIGTVKPAFAPAFLQLATVESYLAAMEAPDYDPFRSLIDVPHWRRLWWMFRQSRRAGL